MSHNHSQLDRQKRGGGKKRENVSPGDPSKNDRRRGPGEANQDFDILSEISQLWRYRKPDRITVSQEQNGVEREKQKLFRRCSKGHGKLL